MTIGADVVEAAYHAGLAVIPPAQDGSKKPLPPGDSRWKQYQTERPPLTLLRRWYDPKNGLTGIGVVTGAVSGNLECLDFDTREGWLAYREMAGHCGILPLVDRVWAGYGEETPRGAHLMYRCNTLAGNTRLARDAQGKTFIETRGEGGYVIIAPSNGRVHPSGLPYRCVSGSLATICTLSDIERKDLWEVAKSMDAVPKTPDLGVDPLRSSGDPGNRPGEDFNRRATWLDVLEPLGWSRVFQRGDTTYWRRPGKNEGVSATTNYGGTDYLYVFTTSTPLDSERAYTKFGAFAVLNHAGDFRMASQALGKAGYGEQPRKRPEVRPNQNPPHLSSVPPLHSARPESAAAPAVNPVSGEFVSLADFINGPPKSSYLIKKVWPGRGLAQVFGSSNVGKSFVLIDMACHVAAGMPWRGHKTRKCTVLYIAAEGLSGLSARFKAWTQRHGEIPANLYIRPFPVGLTAAGAAAALAERILSLPEIPHLIILDTLAANFGPGNENSAQDMALALEGLRALAGDWLVVSAHHSGHGEKERSRGHSSLFAALDIEIHVTRDDPLGPIKVAHSKCRDMERMEPLYFNLETEKLPWADEDGEPINSAVLVPVESPDLSASGNNPKQPAGKSALALQLLHEMYSLRQGNVGVGGIPRVFLREWYEAMTFEPDKAHRNRIKRSLEVEGFIKIENGVVSPA